MRDSFGRFMKGICPWNKGKEHEAVKGENNPAKRPEVRKQLSVLQTGKSLSNETKRKISNNLSGRVLAEAHKEKIRSGVLNSSAYKEAIKLRKVEPNRGNFKKGQSPWNYGLTGLHSSSNTKFTSEGLKQLWQDNDFRQKVITASLKSRSLKPNKIETHFLDLIDIFHWPFGYTGNGDFVVNNLCPDFTHNYLPIVIEIFGDYWHDAKRRVLRENQTETGRIKAYKECGYDCLVVWERELKEKSLAIAKVETFLEGI